MISDDMATLFAYGLDAISKYGSIDDAYEKESVGAGAQLDYKFAMFKVSGIEENMLIEINTLP
ncbi:MAG: hypothetical protein HYZ42_08985 [Bacteroidetes bacterium]|nr:hypothetical protein [Bacteroidota bacterium]